jgi:putative peptidoglycan lipid II flippase
MNKVFGLINKEFTNINQAALWLGFFGLLAKFLALLRDRSLAHFIGPSTSLDIYYAAFKIPDLIFLSIASLISVTVLIPFLIEKGEAAQAFFSQVFSIFLKVMVFVSAGFFFLMPLLTPLVAPGFKAPELKLLTDVSRIMLISPILLGLSNNLFGSVVQLHKKFFVFALTPIFYNLGIIAGVVFLFPIWGVYGLGIGVAIASMLHLLVQLPAVRSSGYSPSLVKKIEWSSIKSLLYLSFPRTLGLVINNLALIVLGALASLASTGSISIFNFSLNLQAVPYDLIGVSFSIAAFPALASFISEGKREEFVAHITSAARQIIFWSLPLTFLFIILRAQIVRVILGSGSFSWVHTRLTAAALALFAISILAQSMILLFTRGYYAAGETRKPLKVNLFSAFFIVVSAFSLFEAFRSLEGFRLFVENLLRVPDVPGTEMLMLPLAYSLGVIANFIWLWIKFKKDFLPDRPFLSKAFFQSLTGSFAIGVVSYYSLNMFGKIFNLETFWGILGQGAFAGILGIAAGIIALKLMKNEEMDEVWAALRSKFWKAKTFFSFLGF